MIKDLLLGAITQDEFLRINNANITFVTLPEYIRGFTLQYVGIYNIFINKGLKYYWKKKTLLHEFAHIELNQFCQCDKDLIYFHVKNYEDAADDYIRALKSI